MGGTKELRGCIDCVQVPVFRPTEAEWRDPLGYLASIRRQAELIGMAKIIPPPRWEAQHVPDQDGVTFKTKVQSVHEMQWKDTVTEAKQFWAMFNAFQESTGGSKGRKKPVFAGQEIDLYRLYRVVGKRGGFAEVCCKKRWKEVVNAMEVCLCVCVCLKCRGLLDHSAWIHDGEYENNLIFMSCRLRIRVVMLLLR